MNIDRKKGVYRQIYGCMLTGKRINSVSLVAEAVFVRMQLVADDYGHLVGDPDLLKAQLAPRRRELDIETIEQAAAELVAGGLIRRYEAEGDAYIEIVDWHTFQAAPKNGRRIERVPQPEPTVDHGESGGIRGNPGETKTDQSEPGESGAAQVKPGESRSPDTDTDTDPRSDPVTHSQTQSGTDPDPMPMAKANPVPDQKPEAGPDRTGIANASPAPGRTGPVIAYGHPVIVPEANATSSSHFWPEDYVPFQTLFCDRLKQAFAASAGEYAAQRRSFHAMARRLHERSDRDELADFAVVEARARRPSAGLDNRFRAWQACMDRYLEGTPDPCDVAGNGVRRGVAQAVMA